LTSLRDALESENVEGEYSQRPSTTSESCEGTIQREENLMAATVFLVLIFKLFKWREGQREKKSMREKEREVSAEGLKQDSAVK
jgi:hypothetical protein